jgi:OOP family OmpA-OmpF porin
VNIIHDFPWPRPAPLALAALALGLAACATAPAPRAAREGPDTVQPPPPGERAPAEAAAAEPPLLVLEIIAGGAGPGSTRPEAADALLTFLREHAELAHVELGAHTDSRGSGAFNKQASQQRAEALRQFLVDNGIDAARLSARGYGEELPVASNATAAGRAANARIELRTAPPR